MKRKRLGFPKPLTAAVRKGQRRKGHRLGVAGARGGCKQRLLEAEAVVGPIKTTPNWKKG